MKTFYITYRFALRTYHTHIMISESCDLDLAIVASLGLYNGLIPHCFENKRQIWSYKTPKDIRSVYDNLVNNKAPDDAVAQHLGILIDMFEAMEARTSYTLGDHYVLKFDTLHLVHWNIDADGTLVMRSPSRRIDFVRLLDMALSGIKAFRSELNPRYVNQEVAWYCRSLFTTCFPIAVALDVVPEMRRS